MRNRSLGVLAGTLLLAAWSVPKVYAAHINNRNGIRHVLLISVDGMHALDYANCANGISGFKGGTPYCPNLKALGEHGVTYLNSSTSRPSDSFPGLMAIVTGGSPRTVGAYYDVAYDRSLQPPAVDTGNGLSAGSCTPGQTPDGTRTEYEEGIDYDQTQLNGGGTDGQANAIDPSRLERDPANDCKPVYPYNFVRTNTIFGVIHKAGGRTAWSDKHAAYIAVSGPGDGTNVDDFYSPEINSNASNFATQAPPQLVLPECMQNGVPTLPDQNAIGGDYTSSFQNIQCYDGLKVMAMVNEIAGKTHSGTGHAPMPNILGMNFQAVSIGEKLVYQYGSVASGYSTTGGDLDSIGTPSDSLLQEIEFVDNSIGLMVNELKKEHQYDSTLIIITAKHGQSPIDPARLLRIPGDNGGESPATIISTLLPDSEVNQIGPTEDDVSLLWLANNTPAETATAVGMLQSGTNPVHGGYNGGEIFWGPSLDLMFGDPATDPRTPNIVVAPNVGVIYTGGKKKVSEHGGFAHDDTNVIMLLANPDFSPESVNAPVQTAQVAPTILKALGLDPHSLQAVDVEHTAVLPGLSLN
ncbi:MAG TPA: alkaline phosphatase family protein [Candidatus Binataceae bacterium]|nr:alkaline phosphatase family protein [Candidatus Binataceae bacterium]